MCIQNYDNICIIPYISLYQDTHQGSPVSLQPFGGQVLQNWGSAGSTACSPPSSATGVSTISSWSYRHGFALVHFFKTASYTVASHDTVEHAVKVVEKKNGNCIDSIYYVLYTIYGNCVIL